MLIILILYVPMDCDIVVAPVDNVNDDSVASASSDCWTWELSINS